MSATAPQPDPMVERLDALDRRLDRLEGAVDRLVDLLDRAPDAIAMVADTADDMAARASNRGVDVEARVVALAEAVERLTEPGTLESLVRLAESAEGLDTAILFASKLDDHIAMAADTFDDFAGKAARRGIDVDARILASLQAVEQLTEPRTLGALIKLAESADGLETAVLFATKMDDHIAMAADTFDAWAVAQANKGIDIDKRIASLSTALEAFTQPAVVEVLTRLVQHSDTLFETGILADETVTALGNIGAALPRAIRETSKPLGLWGLITAFNKPEVQRAAGLAVSLATHVGAALDRPTNLLEKHA